MVLRGLRRGRVEIDRDAITYYRYERITEDIGVDATSVFGDRRLPETSRASQVALIQSFFEPGGILETVEAV